MVAQQEEWQGNPVRASLYYEQAAEVTSDPSSPQAEESRERKQERALGEERYSVRFNLQPPCITKQALMNWK